jgi:hypothetical protein
VFTAIAEKYGQDCTAKAVSTRFERLKKEPEWDLTSDPSANVDNSGGAVPKTPTRGAIPRKRKTPAKKTKTEDGSEEDDNEQFSPSKKESTRKVANGRVTKQKTPRKAAPKMGVMAESGQSSGESDAYRNGEEEAEIKEEDGVNGRKDSAYGSLSAQGGQIGHANGGDMDVDEKDEFHDSVDMGNGEGSEVYA